MISVVILISALTGCGGINESSNNNTFTNVLQEAVQVAENVSVEGTESDSIFQITPNGNHKTTVTLTDEAVGELHKNEDSSLRIQFHLDEEVVSEINIYSDAWNMIHIVNQDTRECEGVVDGMWENPNTDQVVLFTIEQMDIVTLFKTFDKYSILFTDAENEMLQTEIANGNMEDIFGASGSKDEENPKHDIQIVFNDDSIVKFKVYGEEAKTAFYNYDTISVRLYENSEQQISKFYIMDFSVSHKNAQGQRMVIGSSITPDINRDGHDMETGDGYNNLSVASDYGVAMKYECDNISNLVGNTRIYELYIGDELMCMGYVDDAVTEMEYSISSIPDVFPTDSMDDKYFLPDTDSYRVIMMEVPYMIDIPVWYRRAGVLVYGANEDNLEYHTATMIMLESYDEFGLLTVKTKIVYEDDMQATYAGADSGNIILNPVPRISEPDDSLTTEELIDSFSQSELYDNPSYSHWYSYLGCFDNVKYFVENIDAISTYDALPIIPPITYSSDERWYKHQRDDSIFDNLQFELKEVVQSSETIHADYTTTGEEVDFEYKITTYSSSESAGNSINYEEEAVKYNTAPENWKEHPYASFFPELPQGVTLKYLPDQTINDETLSLYTGENGCTREQALEYIDELRNIEYEELRYEVENDDEVQLVLVVRDNIFVGAYWRKDEQSMSVYTFKE